MQDLSNQVKKADDYYIAYGGMDAFSETNYAIERCLYLNLRFRWDLQGRMDESFNWQNRPGECLDGTIELRLLPSH